MKNNLKTGLALPALATLTLLFANLAAVQAQGTTENNKVRLKVVKTIDGKTTVTDTTFEKGSAEFEAYQKNLTEAHPALRNLHQGQGRQLRIITDIKDGQATERQLFISDTLKAAQFRMLDSGAVPPHIREMIQQQRSNPIRLQTDEKGNPVIPQIRSAVPPAGLEKMLKENGVEGKRVFVHCEKLADGQKPCLFFADSLTGKLSADEMTIFKRVEGNGNNLVFIKIMKVEKAETEQLQSQQPELEAPKKELKVEDFSVFPNPTVGRFSLNFDLEDKGNTSIRIFDETGRQVYSEDLKGFKGAYKKEIDLSGSPKGVYFVRVDQGKKGFSRKIVLQ